MASCGRLRVPEENPEEAIGKGTAQLQRRSYRVGDAITTGRPPKTATTMAWSWLEFRRQTVCATDGRAIEVPRISWPLEESQMTSAELFTPLDFGLALL